MLSFFRRLINSKLGIIVTFVVLGVIALAFAAGDVTGLRGGTTATGTTVATVGKASISAAELRARVQTELENFRQQQPTLDVAQFVAGGGLEGSLDRMIDALAFEAFAHRQSMAVSDRAIQGQIASIPALQGPDGKFSQAIFDRVLADRHLTYPQLRTDMARDTLSRALLAPTFGAAQVPATFALPYASLMLERREGRMALVPITALGDGTAPTEADIATFYRRNLTRYTLAERRVIRYALVSPDQVKAASVPTDAEVAAAYQTQRTSFAPTERRTIVQVVLPDAAAAGRFMAMKPLTIEPAARAIGLEPAIFTNIDRTHYEAANSAELAAAAYRAKKGVLVGPIRSGLGYIVIRVDAVEQVAGRSLDQAKPELIKTLTLQKSATALGKMHDALDDAITSKSTFDELVADQKLTAVTTPPLLANGVDADAPDARPDPALAPVVAAAFSAEPGDSPQLVPIGPDKFAVVALQRVVGAAPRPLAQSRAAVARDFRIDRASHAARQIAAGVTAAVGRGASLDDALSATHLKLPPSRPVAASRQQLTGKGPGMEALILMFSMAEHSAKLLEAPGRAGWIVIDLQRIERGDATGQPALVASARTELGKVVGREYGEEFSKAVRGAIGVDKNDAAIRQVRTDLLGQDGSHR